MSNELMDVFFAHPSRADVGLTFDDVLLRGARARLAPWEVDLTTRFTRNVTLRLPIASSAMGSVTESRMAIAMAKAGGIGSIHRKLSPQKQAEEVGRVKHHIHGFIDAPKCAFHYDTVAQLWARKEQNKWEYDSFPVVDRNRKLLGLFTHDNYRRCDDPGMRVEEAMTPRDKLLTALESEDIDVHEVYKRLKGSDQNVLLIVKSDDRIVGMWTFTDAKRIVKGEKPQHNVDHLDRLRVAAAVGVGEEAFERAELLVKEGVDVLHVDMANGWQDFVLVETVKKLRAKYKNGPDIGLGNFAVPKAVEEAIRECDPDGIIVGVGGGSICTTRIVTGTGVPQVTAVYQCAREARRRDIPVCSDGGIRYPGDMMIALAAGAESVMVGGYVAATDECPLEKHELPDGTIEMDYYGEGSERAMKESSGSRQRYLQRHGGVLVPEGIEARVLFKGSVEPILRVTKGSLEKGFHSNGSRNIAELHANARFNQVTSAGNRESHPHDVKMVARPLNYMGRS